MSVKGLKTELYALRLTPEMASRVTQAAVDLSSKRNQPISELNFIREAVSDYVEKMEQEKRLTSPRLF